MENSIQGSSWKGDSPPRKILAIRFQALGDTIITLPYLADLKKQFPDVTVHFLTRKECSQIPERLQLFDRVIAIGGGRNAKLQFILIVLALPFFWMQRYDAILDLQNHRISKLLRKFLRVKAWVEFDRTSPISAGERTRKTIEALWSWRINSQHALKFKEQIDVHALLKSRGLLPNHELVVLNPAGFCTSRNWPLENYVSFAKLWLKEINPQTQFVILLLKIHQEKADYFKKSLGEKCIDLTGHANQAEAFEILKKCKLVLSEDSGLMHMAWTQGIPTLALFSSSRKDWSAPQGEWSYCFDSSDMECGPCQLEVCKFGDNRCLTRVSPQLVLDKASTILKSFCG